MVKDSQSKAQRHSLRTQEGHSLGVGGSLNTPRGRMTSSIVLHKQVNAETRNMPNCLMKWQCSESDVMYQ